jgi:hypothetical protein
VGNDLERPDRVRRHVPPLRGATARGHRIHAASDREARDWQTVHSMNRSPGVATQPTGDGRCGARRRGLFLANVGLTARPWDR